MAHLALVVDADPARRAATVGGVRRLFADLPGTEVGEASARDVACVWAAGPRAPVDLHRCGDRFALLIGYAVDDAGRWLSASDIAAAWLGDDGDREVQDGYHVALAYDPVQGLAVGGDPLGLFPVYHASSPGGVRMVATTPEAFTHHPCFPWRIDRLGLAGILLAHGLLDDRPLLAGARRLATGHRLRAPPGSALEPRRIFNFTGTTPPAGETPDEVRERVGGLFLDAIRRHRPAGDDALLMLSGGLDSRLVAGSLADLGAPTRAVTFGRRRDYEVRAATAVARALDMPIEVVSTEDEDAADFVADARCMARFSHLSSGPGGDDFASGLRLTASRRRFLWSGVPLDWVFEPVSSHNGYDAATGTWSLDRMLAMVSAWGVPADRLARLLGGDGAALRDQVVGRLEAACTAGAGAPERLSAIVRWEQRVRNHLAMALHQTSFHAWPLTPSTDRRFFTAVFGLPVPTFADRRLERAILATRRPDLAALPLDTNSFRFEPLLAAGRRPGPLARTVRSLGRRLQRLVHASWLAADPRRYERLFNVDHPRWQAVRYAAEPLRPRLHEHLDAAALAAILPPPGRRLRSRTPIRDGSPVRLLCGLAFLFDRDGTKA